MSILNTVSIAKLKPLPGRRAFDETLNGPTNVLRKAGTVLKVREFKAI